MCRGIYMKAPCEWYDSCDRIRHAQPRSGPTDFGHLVIPIFSWIWIGGYAPRCSLKISLNSEFNLAIMLQVFAWRIFQLNPNCARFGRTDRGCVSLDRIPRIRYNVDQNIQIHMTINSHTSIWWSGSMTMMKIFMVKRNCIWWVSQEHWFVSVFSLGSCDV